MLIQMHRHMKWIMWGIVVLITVTFLFFGIYPSETSSGSAAKVNGYVITIDELNRVYQNMYDNYREILKDNFPESLSKGLRSQALRELIQNRLLIQEAERMGLRISDEELQAYILKIPAFSPGGKFDKKIYDSYFDRVNIKPEAFEMSQREYLLRQKLERLVEDSVAVNDSELAGAYATRNPKAKAGEFEKNRDSFRKQLLAEKQRDALTVYVRNLQSKADIKSSEKSQATL